MPIPEWSFRPKHRVDSGNHINNGQTISNNDSYHANEDSMSDDYNSNGNAAEDDTLSESNEDSNNTIGNGNLSIRHYPATNAHTIPQQPMKIQQYNGNGTDAKSKLRIIKEGSSRNLAAKSMEKQKSSHLQHFLTPRSPATPTNYNSNSSNYNYGSNDRNTPSPPFKFALTTSPPTPHKEKAPSALDPTVEVQKLRTQLQKAMQEINGFKIYKVKEKRKKSEK